MKPSRFSSFLHIALICCTLYSSNLSAQSAADHTESESLPLTGRSSFSTPDTRRNDPLMPPGNAATPSAGNEEGRSRLRSAYDRSSNPAYYDMLDRLERDQKRRGHHRSTARASTPPTDSASDSGTITEKFRGHARKHHRHAKRSRYTHHKHSKKSKHAKHAHSRKSKSAAHHHSKKRNSHAHHARKHKKR
ncbi:MAG: hypothetical protein V4525_14955 [Pseudomonadota bacterium]